MFMNFTFDDLKEKAVDVAQVAAQKAKDLASFAKAKATIASEEVKIRKAYAELGKLYYRDFVMESEMDSAEYLPWCEKISASKALIDDLKNGECEVEEDDDLPEEELTVEIPVEASEEPEE